MNKHFTTKMQRIKADLYALRDEIVAARRRLCVSCDGFGCNTCRWDGIQDTPSLFDLHNDIEQAIDNVLEAQNDVREYMKANVEKVINP